MVVLWEVVVRREIIEIDSYTYVEKSCQAIRSLGQLFLEKNYGKNERPKPIT